MTSPSGVSEKTMPSTAIGEVCWPPVVVPGDAVGWFAGAAEMCVIQAGPRLPMFALVICESDEYDCCPRLPLTVGQSWSAGAQQVLRSFAANGAAF